MADERARRTPDLEATIVVDARGRRRAAPRCPRINPSSRGRKSASPAAPGMLDRDARAVGVRHARATRPSSARTRPCPSARRDGSQIAGASRLQRDRARISQGGDLRVLALLQRGRARTIWCRGTENGRSFSSSGHMDRNARNCRLELRHFDTEQGRIANFPRKGDRNSRETGVLPFLSCARLFGERRPELIGMPEDFLLPLERLYQRRQGERWFIPWAQVR